MLADELYFDDFWNVREALMVKDTFDILPVSIA